MSLLKFKSIILVILGFFTSIFMFNISIIFQSIIFLFFVLFLMSLYQERGILHPFSWYPVLFFLYSVSYPLYLALYEIDNFSASKVIPMCFIALLSFICSFLLFELEKREVNYNLTFKKYDKPLRLVGWLLILLCNLLNFFVLLSGVSTKREFLILVENYGIGFLFVLFFLLSLVNALVLKNDIEKYGKLKFKIFLISSIMTFFFAFGVTGERDLLFRFLLLILLICFSFWIKYKVWLLCLGLSIFVIILPLTQQLKAFFVSSNLDLVYNDGDYLNSEFASSGRNLLYLIERNINNEGLSIFINDVYRFFNFLGIEKLSATAWFNEVVRHKYGDSGVSGWGFSLVGEGYVTFGINGIVGLFLFLGGVTAVLYNHIANRFVFCMYLMYIPSMIYVIRADLSNFLSLNFKVNLILVSVLFFILKIFDYFSRKTRKRKM